MATHLVIPDTHVKPEEEDLERFILTNKLIKDVKPDQLIHIGDHYDMFSLCSYEKGKGSFVGANYSKDIDAGNHALDILMKGIPKKTETTFCIGNHEQRVAKAVNSQPEFAGMWGLGMQHMDVYKKFDHVVEYEGSTPGTKTIDGVTYAHFMASGPMAKAIGGVNHARSLVLKTHVSCTVGHSHFLDFYTEVDGAGKRLMGLVAGCLKGPKADSYAGTSARNYWRGVVLKHEVEDGVYSPQFISFDMMKKIYS